MCKKNLLLLLLVSSISLFAATEEFVLEAKSPEKPFETETPLKLELKTKAPAGYAAKAWRLVAYVPDLPPEFAAATGAKVTEHKQKEWSTVAIMVWDWKIPDNGILQKSTEKWPAGDYKMVLYILFMGKDSEGKKLPDKMVETPILFTLKKAELTSPAKD